MIYTYFADRGGWRYVVLFHKGRKWLRALDTATLETYRLPAAQLDRFVPCAELTNKTLARRLASRRAAFKRMRIPFPEAQAAKAIRALRTQD